MSKSTGMFPLFCACDIDILSEQLEALFSHYHKLDKEITTEFKRLRRSSMSQEKRWHRAHLNILGSDYFYPEAHIHRAITLYCVALYLSFHAALTSMRSKGKALTLLELMRRNPGLKKVAASKIIHELKMRSRALRNPIPPQLVTYYPGLKRAVGYGRVYELWLVYQAVMDGRYSIAAEKLKRLRPDYFGQGREVNPVLGNLGLKERDFYRYTSAIKEFAPAVRKQLSLP